jgi:hypothetical protein
MGTLGATLLAALLYAANYHPKGLPFHVPLPAILGEVPPVRHTIGATPLGLAFGTLSFAIFLFASALGLRKKLRLWPVGHVRLWLKAHIWLSILTIPLILFHCGFQFGGIQARWLLILYAVVMLSGFLGLALQQFMPGLMKERLPREVIFEQIPRLRGQLLAAATEMRESLRAVGHTAASAERQDRVAVAEEPSQHALERFLDEACLPYLAATRGERLPLGEAGEAAGIFRAVRANVSDDLLPQVDTLEQWCQERRQMDLQTKLHHWLHGWLLVHVPASFALLVFTVWHASAALRFLILSS